jgi:Astacin (Peptidase family M12A)
MKFLGFDISAAVEKALIVSSLDQVMKVTCKKFAMRTNETAYLNVKSNRTGGCWAILGYQGKKQDLNLGN